MSLSLERDPEKVHCVHSVNDAFPIRKVLYAVLASVLSQFAFCTVSMARKLHALSCLPEWNPETVLKLFYVLYSFCRPRGAKPVEGFNK